MVTLRSDLLPACADIEVQVVPVVVLQLLHVELHPGHLVGVVVRGQEPAPIPMNR